MIMKDKIFKMMRMRRRMMMRKMSMMMMSLRKSRNRKKSKRNEEFLITFNSIFYKNHSYFQINEPNNIIFMLF